MLKAFVVSLLATASVLAAATVQANAESSTAKIALSNNYAGNSWRQAMLKSWDKTTKQAAADHIVATADAFTTAENQVTEQAAQIQNLILQNYNAIVVDAASPEALNGSVKQACDAGIVVVSFDGIVTEPCAYRVVLDFKAMGHAQTDFLAKKFPNGANVLEIRGLAGSSIDADIHAGVVAGAKDHPGLKIVGSVVGDWNGATAQKAVAQILPSMPKIDAVAAQGGDGYGAAQAFKAAQRPTPTIILGNRQDELAWWEEQKKANGYETWSAATPPGLVTLAFWVTQQILDGKKVPHTVVVPYLAVTQDELESALASTPVGGLANKEYTQEEAIKAIEANAK
jgi:ribose transport system substrate-binding protein